MRTFPLIVLVAALLGCAGGGDDDDDLAAPDAGGGGGGGGSGNDEELATATGCAGVFNVDQLLDYDLTVAAGDWSQLLADTTNSLYVPAQLSCAGSTPIQVGVRRKRSGSNHKPGLKVDINFYVAGQSYFGLKKLSLENGISEGGSSGSAKDLVAEYLAWRLQVQSGAVAGRAAFARVRVNDELLGAYVNVEQVDKRFLRARLGDDSGWLFKYSGSEDDGQKTNEGTADPYAAALCFLERSGCATPSDAELATTLPALVDVPQLLTVGAVNAIMANTDAILLKFNNYIYYDSAAGPRLYLPWDLDTAMNGGYHVVTGTVPGGTTRFTDALFGNWEADYRALVAELLAGPLTLAAIEGELDRAITVAGAALDQDPHIDGDAASAAAALATWWATRHPAVAAQVAP